MRPVWEGCLSVCHSWPKMFPPPTHNREPNNTQLSDTIASDPPVKPMPFSFTRFM
jgi:hypothetical protein